MTEPGSLDLSNNSNQVTALVHLYRAEVGKMTAYRVRLDTTTNWAISSSAVVATLALGSSAVPHAAFLFLMALIYFFLHLEARRYRAYEASRYRVLLLERHFYPWALNQPTDPQWPRYLHDALMDPGLTVNSVGALGWRLRRNYLWIYGVVLLTWIARLDIGLPTGETAAGIVDRASVGSVPGVVVMGVVAVFYLALLGLALWATRVYPMGDEQSVQMLLKEGDG